MCTKGVTLDWSTSELSLMKQQFCILFITQSNRISARFTNKEI